MRKTFSKTDVWENDEAKDVKGVNEVQEPTETRKLSPSKNTDPEAYYQRLRWMYQQMKEEARNLYFFCYMDRIGMNGFCRKFGRYSRIRVDKHVDNERGKYNKWLFGHTEVLQRTYVYVEEMMTQERFAYFMYMHSSPCNCYEIEKGDDNHEQNKEESIQQPKLITTATATTTTTVR